MEIRVDLVPQPAPSATDGGVPAARSGSGLATVVVDVLRTGTVAPLLFERGASAVTLTPSVRAARQVSERRGALLAGERGGVPIEGFNHSSSPSLLRGIELGGREVVLLSDEVPAALDGVRGAVWLAGLTNAVAVAERVAAAEPSLVQVVCAGDRGEPDLADTIAAGLLVALLDRAARRHAGASVNLVGAARYCLSVLRTTKDPLDGIWAAAAAAELRAVGLEEDLAMASEVAVSDVVPRVEGCETVAGRRTVRLGVG
jgi:2-phosphosulfolactate phosphatase